MRIQASLLPNNCGKSEIKALKVFLKKRGGNIWCRCKVTHLRHPIGKLRQEEEEEKKRKRN